MTLKHELMIKFSRGVMWSAILKTRSSNVELQAITPLQNLSKIQLRNGINILCRRRIPTPKGKEFKENKIAWIIITWTLATPTASQLTHQTWTRWILSWLIIREYSFKSSRKVTASLNMWLPNFKIVTLTLSISRLFSRTAIHSNQCNVQIN